MSSWFNPLSAADGATGQGVPAFTDAEMGLDEVEDAKHEVIDFTVKPERGSRLCDYLYRGSEEHPTGDSGKYCYNRIAPGHRAEGVSDGRGRFVFRCPQHRRDKRKTQAVSSIV